MKLKKSIETFFKQRRLILILPMIALSCVLLFFWALRMGTTVDDTALSDKQGINTMLPDANLSDDKTLDKMSYYEKAASDSAKRKELMKNDPFYKNPEAFNSGTVNYDNAAQEFNVTHKHDELKGRGRKFDAYSDPNELEVYQKIEELNAVLKTNGPESKQVAMQNNRNIKGVSSSKIALNKLEKDLLNATEANGEDPEIEQLNGMLDRILDIQHPERVKENIWKSAVNRKDETVEVSPKREDNMVSLITGRKANQSTDIGEAGTNKFYSAYDGQQANQLQTAINAVVYGTQTVVDGSTVKLRLLQDVVMRGIILPKNNFVFGVASLKGERLEIKITSIRHINSLYSVDLSIYDMDGMSGIYIPGAITREVAKQSSDLAIQNVGYSNLDASLKAQAATVGVEAVKSLLSKKVKLIKVIVKSGYQVLLKDEKKEQKT